MTAILIVQCATFVALGVRFLAAGEWKLGLSQLLLAAVQGLVYS